MIDETSPKILACEKTTTIIITTSIFNLLFIIFVVIISFHNKKDFLKVTCMFMFLFKQDFPAK